MPVAIRSATGSDVGGIVIAASNWRNPSSAIAAINPGIPPKYVYTAIVEVPAALAILRVCNPSGPSSLRMSTAACSNSSRTLRSGCEVMVVILTQQAYDPYNIAILMLSQQGGRSEHSRHSRTSQPVSG